MKKIIHHNYGLGDNQNNLLHFENNHNDNPTILSKIYMRSMEINQNLTTCKPKTLKYFTENISSDKIPWLFHDFQRNVKFHDFSMTFHDFFIPWLFPLTFHDRGNPGIVFVMCLVRVLSTWWPENSWSFPGFFLQDPFSRSFFLIRGLKYRTAVHFQQKIKVC